MDKRDEKRVREIAREEALKCIKEENHRKFREAIEFMGKIRLPKRVLDSSKRES